MSRTLLAILAAAVAVGGCGPGAAPSNGDAKPLSADEQISQIESNPNMPAEAKAAATARLRQGQAQGQTKTGGSGK